MYCPQCGQQQATGVIRFCSRCGFPLDGVIHLLGNAGILPVYHDPTEPVQISARRKGVKQGGMLLLGGAVLVPLVGILADYSNSTFLEILTAFAAVICFLGGPLRMLYAGLFEEGAPKRSLPMAQPFVGAPPHSAQFGMPPRHAALPPQSAQRPAQWRQRPVTAELAGPPSVTEGTTRLLDKEDRAERK